MLIAIVLDRPLADANALVDDSAAFTREMTGILLEKQNHPHIAKPEEVVTHLSQIAHPAAPAAMNTPEPVSQCSSSLTRPQLPHAKQPLCRCYHHGVPIIFFPVQRRMACARSFNTMGYP